jgi:Uma2 family endonuclease
VVVEALHRVSPDEYRRLVDAGVCDEDARIELIDGLLVDMSPKTPAHENAIAWLVRYLVLNVDLERYKRRDLVDKPPIYAQAGVPVYWVVDAASSASTTIGGLATVARSSSR